MDNTVYVIFFFLSFMFCFYIVDYKLRRSTDWGVFSIMVSSICSGFIFTYLILIPLFAAVQFGGLTKQERISQHFSAATLFLPSISVIIIFATVIYQHFFKRIPRPESKKDR